MHFICHTSDLVGTSQKAPDGLTAASLLASLPTKPVLTLPSEGPPSLGSLPLCNYSDWEELGAHLIFPASPKVSFKAKLSSPLSLKAFLSSHHNSWHFVYCARALPRLLWAHCVRSIPFTYIQTGEILLDSELPRAW